MPELRQSPSTKEWVIIATERAQRPEAFQRKREAGVKEAEFSKECPFCSGNEALTPPEIMAYRDYGTEPNKPGWWIRVFPNKFPALIPQGNVQRVMTDDFFRYMDGVGEHEVIVEHPKHDQTIATMSQKQVEEIFLAYRERCLMLKKDPRFELIQIFKNHGPAAGTSVRHPHSQLIASPITPMHIRHRVEEAMRYFDDNGECVFCVMLRKELKNKERLILETDNFAAFIPFAAKSPFETWVIPKKHDSSFEYIKPQICKELGYVMKVLLSKIYTSLKDPDYNYIIRSSPCHEKDVEYYHWHIHIIPRVVKAAGFELGSGMFINTIIPESAAKFLREAKTE